MLKFNKNKPTGWKHPADNRIVKYWRNKYENLKSTNCNSRANDSRKSSHIIIIVVRD